MEERDPMQNRRVCGKKQYKPGFPASTLQAYELMVPPVVSTAPGTLQSTSEFYLPGRPLIVLLRGAAQPKGGTSLYILDAHPYTDTLWNSINNETESRGPVRIRH